MNQCKYCREQATKIRFIKESKEEICDDRRCDLKSLIKHGLYRENDVSK